MKLLEVSHPLPTQTGEEAAGPESIEGVGMQSSFIATPRELKIGENVELEIEVKNMRKEETIILTNIIGIIPEGFAVRRKPELYRVEGNCLIMREKMLEPSKTEIVKLVLTPESRGTFHIKPKIIYTDEKGKEKTHMPKPVSITVKELGIKGWLKGEK